MEQEERIAQLERQVQELLDRDNTVGKIVSDLQERVKKIEIDIDVINEGGNI